MACTACLVCLISRVSGCSKESSKCGTSSVYTIKLRQSIFLDIYGTATKIHCEVKAQVVGTKHIRQADKAGKPTRQPGLPALFCAYY